MPRAYDGTQLYAWSTSWRSRYVRPASRQSCRRGGTSYAGIDSGSAFPGENWQREQDSRTSFWERSSEERRTRRLTPCVSSPTRSTRRSPSCTCGLHRSSALRETQFLTPSHHYLSASVRRAESISKESTPSET